jgi:hypothetical protein
MTEPKTNRDVINAMTDEELAKWKCKFQSMDKTGPCRVYWQNPQRCLIGLHCVECSIEWLTAPARKHQEVGK